MSRPPSTVSAPTGRRPPSREPRCHRPGHPEPRPNCPCRAAYQRPDPRQHADHHRHRRHGPSVPVRIIDTGSGLPEHTNLDAAFEPYASTSDHPETDAPAGAVSAWPRLVRAAKPPEPTCATTPTTEHSSAYSSPQPSDRPPASVRPMWSRPRAHLPRHLPPHARQDPHGHRIGWMLPLGDVRDDGPQHHLWWPAGVCPGCHPQAAAVTWPYRWPARSRASPGRRGTSGI